MCEGMSRGARDAAWTEGVVERTLMTLGPLLWRRRRVGMPDPAFVARLRTQLLATPAVWPGSGGRAGTMQVWSAHGHGDASASAWVDQAVALRWAWTTLLVSPIVPLLMIAALIVVALLRGVHLARQANTQGPRHPRRRPTPGAIAALPAPSARLALPRHREW